MMSQNPETIIRRGISQSHDAIQAVHELWEQIAHEGMSVCVAFCSSKYDLNDLGKELKARFSCPVICCTTAGEIGPNGYDEWSLTGLTITSPHLQVYSRLIENVSEFSSEKLNSLAVDLNSQLVSAKSRMPAAKAFGLLLIDGLSVAEEPVISTLYSLFRDLPIVGGSAGDDLKFNRTQVYIDGEFKSNCACFTVFVTTLPFEVFITQHFYPTDKKFVITAATPETRTVQTINGRPAADEYARLVGVTRDELNADVFSRFPCLLRIGGDYYVRSPQKINPDGSITFFCAIEKGLVMTIGAGKNIEENLDHVLRDVEQRNNTQVIIGCECILRRLEVLQKDLWDSTSRILARHKVIGFNTYGEQYNSVHVNHTFTGVAIGT
jgi:hypothetical protein